MGKEKEYAGGRGGAFYKFSGASQKSGCPV